MSTRVAVIFSLAAIVGLLIFRDLNVNPYRTISSVSELDSDQVAELHKASIMFETLQATSSENFAKNKEIFESILPMIEDGRSSNTQMVRLFSNATLMHIYFNLGDMESFQIHIRDFFSERPESNQSDIALQYLNLVLKLADKYDQEDLSTILESTEGISAFAMLMHSNIEVEKLSFESEEERSLFSFILNSAIYHTRFSYHLKRNLSPSKDSEFFTGNWKHSFKSFIKRNDQRFTLPTLNENEEIHTFVLPANYNLDYLRSLGFSWQHRNDMMEMYLSRLEYQNIEDWAKEDKISDKELASAALVRYSNFEIKLPTRNNFIKIIESFGTDSSIVAPLKATVKSIDNQVIEYFKRQYSQFSHTAKSGDEILEVERSVFKNQGGKDKRYFGLFHDMMTNSTSLLPVAKEMELYKKEVAQGKTLNKKHFKLNYALQNIDALWIQNTCFVASAVNSKLKKRVIYQGGQPLTNSGVRFKSPYSGISYDPIKYCDLDYDNLQRSLSRKFMWQDTKHVVYDAFLIGEESVALSVLTFLLTAGITQVALKPLMKYSAKLAATELVKAQTKKQAVIQWLKYTAFPKYVIGYFINSITLGAVRSVLDTGIALATGKSKDGLATLKAYLYNYTIFYLSLPPTLFVMGKVQGAVLKPVAAVLPKMKKYLPTIKPGIMADKFAKVAKWSPVSKADLVSIKNKAVFNLTFAFNLTPTFYVYDVIDYFKSGKEIPLSKEVYMARFNYLSNWTFSWQVITATMAKIPPMPPKPTN